MVITAVSDKYKEMETVTVKRAGELVATISRVIDLYYQDTKIKIVFDESASDVQRFILRDIMSKNISMFNKSSNSNQKSENAVNWMYFKKGTIEQWVFALFELEKRGFTVERDQKTVEYSNKLIEQYKKNDG